MSLQPFAALTTSEIDEAPLSFPWNAQLHSWLSDGTNTAFLKRLRTLSVSAVLGLGAATGEWLAFRLRRHEVDPRFEAFVEDTWACATSAEPACSRALVRRASSPNTPGSCETASLRLQTRTFRRRHRVDRSAGTSFKNWRRRAIERLATATGEFAHGPRFLAAYHVPRHQRARCGARTVTRELFDLERRLMP